MISEEIIQKLVQLEWEFFQEVRNEGGRADCQNNRQTFEIMRRSQFDAWPDFLLESYLHDLETAGLSGRNPVTEKYARMMKDTAPQQYQAIEPYLPELTEKVQDLIDQIVRIQLAWMDSYTKTCPHLSSGNRVTRQADAGYGETSFESYLRGELSTCSQQTLELYLTYVTSLLQQEKNLVLMTITNTVQKYGYRNLEEAETACRREQEI